MVGFTLNERHCERDMKLRYIPDEKGRAGYAAGWDVQMQENTTADGAAFYSRRQKSKNFDLKCFYEEITNEELRRIERWLDEAGTLIFDEMPFAVWDVVPNEMPDITKYPTVVNGEKRWSGIVEIHLVAPDPNARLLIQMAEPGSAGYSQTGLISENVMPEAATANDTMVYIYNPGNARCGLNIKTAGNAGTDGFTIVNEANGQSCTLEGFTKDITGTVYQWIEADGDTMRTMRKGAATEEYGYAFHDDGYIWLEPCTPFEKDIPVTYSNGYLEAESDIFRSCMKGQFAYFAGQWRRILSVENMRRIRIGTIEGIRVLGEFTIGEDVLGMGSGTRAAADNTVTIATLNPIRIRRSSDTELTRLEFSYQPKLRIR